MAPPPSTFGRIMTVSHRTNGVSYARATSSSSAASSTTATTTATPSALTSSSQGTTPSVSDDKELEEEKEEWPAIGPKRSNGTRRRSQSISSTTSSKSRVGPRFRGPRPPSSTSSMAWQGSGWTPPQSHLVMQPDLENDPDFVVRRYFSPASGSHTFFASHSENIPYPPRSPRLRPTLPLLIGPPPAPPPRSRLRRQHIPRAEDPAVSRVRGVEIIDLTAPDDALVTDESGGWIYPTKDSLPGHERRWTFGSVDFDADNGQPNHSRLPPAPTIDAGLIPQTSHKSEDSQSSSVGEYHSSLHHHYPSQFDMFPPPPPTDLYTGYYTGPPPQQSFAPYNPYQPPPQSPPPPPPRRFVHNQRAGFVPRGGRGSRGRGRGGRGAYDYVPPPSSIGYPYYEYANSPPPPPPPPPFDSFQQPTFNPYSPYAPVPHHPDVDPYFSLATPYSSYPFDTFGFPPAPGGYGETPGNMNIIEESVMKPGSVFVTRSSSPVLHEEGGRAVFSEEMKQEVEERLKKQVEYYLSEENLRKDLYLRRNMDTQGYIPLTLVQSFPRVKSILTELPVTDMVTVLRSSDALTLGIVAHAHDDWYVRPKQRWDIWILGMAVPSSVQEEAVLKRADSMSTVNTEDSDEVEFVMA